MAGGGVAALGVHTERAAQYKGRMTLAVAMTSLVAAVGGAIFGYDIGISGTYVSPPADCLRPPAPRSA
jgi:MFS transporter, SP family, sugar:H+ symporter